MIFENQNTQEGIRRLFLFNYLFGMGVAFCWVMIDAN